MKAENCPNFHEHGYTVLIKNYGNSAPSITEAKKWLTGVVRGLVTTKFLQAICKLDAPFV